MTLSNTTRIGAAAAHLVCADLLERGFSAFLAAEGAAYDVVLDIGGRLIRVQAKGCQAPRSRSGRYGGFPVYHFMSSRNHRPLKAGEKAVIRRYDQVVVDLLAFVALDVRAVAYAPVLGALPHNTNFYPIGTPPFMRSGVATRTNIDAAPIGKALIALGLAEVH